MSRTRTELVATTLVEKSPTIKCIILRTDGTTDEHRLPFDWLLPAQKLVGGYVELVRTRDNHTLIVDEEGLLKGKPINRIATPMYNSPGNCIVGDALLLFLKKEDLP
jgi:hypothetical protein